MKKIGIITIYDENNYGNRLQNYAVQQTLRKLGFETETIKNTNIVNGENYLDRVEKVAKDRRARFKEFNDTYMKLSEDVIFHHECTDDFHEGYDYFVIGSDQIWNYTYEDRFSDFAFAAFAPIEKRVAFSASFGISEVPEEDHKEYKKLHEMKAISVREHAGKDIVKDITGRDDAVVLLDPTMTLTAEEWSEIIKKPEKLTSEKYIVKYFLGKLSEEKEQEIQRFAKEHGCDIIDVLDEKSFHATGPSEFLYLVKNSFCVMTDSFHSCVFSILFNKPFVVFERDQTTMRNMMSRIETLLKTCELSNRIFDGKLTDDYLDINYDKLPEILNRERERTMTFLKNALDVK